MNPRIEDAIGVVDGVNKDFTTPDDYVAGSLEVWRGGLLLRRQDDDGWTETGSNSFQLKVAPLPSDVIRVYFHDTLPYSGVTVEGMLATLVAAEDISGILDDLDSITGLMEIDESLQGILAVEESLSGELVAIDYLTAIIEEGICLADGPKVVVANCLAADSEGDPVYITGPKVGVYYQVATADATDPTKVPAFGIIISKQSDTTCTVQWFGELADILTGLSTAVGDRILYLGAGEVVQAAPGGGAYVQALGTVIDSNEVLLEPDWSELPVPAYVSHFNTTDGTTTATVGDVSTTSRNVADPDGHYDIDDWTPGTAHPTTRTSPIAYAPAEEFSVLDNSTTVFTATLYGADGSVAAQHSVTLTGNLAQTQNGITITVTNWAADINKYKADISVSFALATILPTGGRFSIELEHNDQADGTFTKTQSDLFYDKESSAAALAGVSIAETPGAVATRYLSGVEYYDIGSQFTVGIADIDWLNDESYPNTQVDIQGSEYGLPALALQGSSLTGWTNAWDDTDSAYQKSNWAITQVDLTAKLTTANIRARTKDWSDGSWVNSPDAAILIETHDDTNNRLVERFYLEDWRCNQAADFDAADAKGWVSANPKAASDALLYDGGCEHNSDDWGAYDPNAGSQPDYSAHTGTQYLIREFKHDGSASSGFTLPISGTYTSVEYKLAAAWDGTPSGGTVWIDGTAAYNAAQWNNGSPTGGTGGLLGSDHFTFGTNNIINTGDTVYVRIGLSSGERIEGPLSIVFD